MSWKDNHRIDQTMKVIAHILAEEGHDAAAFFDEFGIDPNALQAAEKIKGKPRAKELEIAVMERALELLPVKAGYGLRVGEMMPVTMFGIWGLAIVTSPDIRSAFDTLVRYNKASLLLSNVLLQENETHAKFVVHMDHLPRSIHRFVFERYYSVTISFLREVLPSFDFSGFELQLPFQDPVYEKQLASLTGLRVVGNCLNYAIVADQAFLDVPLPDTDPLMHSQFLAQCDDVLSRKRRLSGYAQTIREHILRSKQFTPKFEEVAASLCVSERTLRRRLAEDNLSFNQIVLETKMTIARELLVESSLPVKVVAERLDYAEPASFARAFKKWWGVSPAKADKNLQVLH